MSQRDRDARRLMAPPFTNQCIVVLGQKPLKLPELLAEIGHGAFQMTDALSSPGELMIGLRASDRHLNSFIPPPGA